MRRVLVLLAAAATLLVLAAGPAAADPANKNTLSFTLNCGSAGTVDAVFELSSSDSFHIVQFSSNFRWKSLDYVTPDGQTGRIERGINGGGHSGLVMSGHDQVELRLTVHELEAIYRSLAAVKELHLLPLETDIVEDAIQTVDVALAPKSE
jgi:hypothetical protein